MFLKMQQLNKVSTLETVAFLRDTRTRQSAMFAEKQTRSVFQPRYFSG